MDNKRARGIGVAGMRKKGSRILWRIVLLLILVHVASGIMTYLLVSGSQNRLLEKSVGELTRVQAEDFSSAYEVLFRFMNEKVFELVGGYQTEDLIAYLQAILDERTTDIQVLVSDELQKFIDQGFIGVDMILVVLFPEGPLAGVLTRPVVIASSQKGLIYNWEVPPSILDAFEEGSPYVFFAEGIPELSLEGEYLALLGDTSFSTNARYGTIATRPFHQEMREIRDFFDGERRTASVSLALIIIFSILLIAVIAYIGLSWLVKRNITHPIEELAGAAERVMGGDLDVRVAVHEGGEFEVLERAFKEMLEVVKKIIERSTEDADESMEQRQLPGDSVE